MEDFFKNEPTRLDSPAERHFTITPSDSADLPIRPRALYCNGAGDAVVRDGYGTDITYTGLTVGQRLEVRAVRVLATGTTATLVGWC